MAEPSRGGGLLFALLFALQCAVLYWPRSPQPPAALPLDKVVHLVVFGAVAWAGHRTGRPGRPLLAALVTHALISEVAQGVLLPQRSGDPLDAVVNLFGTLLGWFGATRPVRLWRGWRPSGFPSADPGRGAQARRR